MTSPELLEPVLQAQRLIDDVLTKRTNNVNSLGAERPAVEWLIDAASLVRLLASRLDPRGAGQQLGELLRAQPPLAFSSALDQSAYNVSNGEVGVRLAHAWGDAIQLPESDRPTVRMHATVHSPAITALCATTALHILANTSVEEARARLKTFPTRGQASTGEFVSKYGTSWELATVLRRDAASARPGATLAVRLVASRFTATGVRRRPLSASKVPASLWTGLVTPALAGQIDYQACAASTAMVAIASRAGLQTAFDSLGHAPRLTEQLRSEVAGILDLQTTRPSGAFAQLLVLHDFLSSTAVPIDYARRRRSFKEPRRLSRRLARRVCEESGLRQTERLTVFMGWYVHELLTGNDLLFTDPYLDLLAGHRRAYVALRQHWRAAPSPTLLRVAERALQVNHLDEPILWSPAKDDDGVLYSPVPDKTRQLSGWHDRPARGESRQPTALDGRPLNEVVLIAEQPNNQSDRRLRIDLARFLLVAETLEMAAASHKLGISASKVSSSRQRLERQLGFQLFVRTGRGLGLTDLGEQLRRLVDQSAIDPFHDGRD